MKPHTSPGKWRLLRWAAVAIILAAVAGVMVKYPQFGIHDIQHWFTHAEEQPAAKSRESQARLVPGSSDEIELPPDVVERLGVKSAPVNAAAAPRPLTLAGSLFFEPNKLGSVQPRFPGEVLAIGTASYPYANGPLDRRDAGPTERPLEYGDRVSQGQIMAVVLCKDLGEKKSELVDALVQLALSEVRLSEREDAYSRGALAEDAINQIRADVASNRNAVAKMERTLRTWRVAENEIEAVKEEARLVAESKKKRDLKKEMEWAKVEVRAPFDGTIVEKNLHVGKYVDATFDLFKIADLRKLGVVVHAYEEDLRTLQALPHDYPWEIRAGADLSHRVLKSDGLQKVGLIVDPTQHTDPIMGVVDNSSGELRVGQFVTATVNLPAPHNVISLPSSALAEDGQESIVFVQPDPTEPRYALRRVSVAMRLRDVVYVRSQLTPMERKKGLQEVKPGEVLVTEGVLELQSALEDLKARAKAQK